MAILERVLERRRLVLTVAFSFSLLGVFCWATMERREDPSMAQLWGQIVVAFPGAEAEMVEQQVLEPIEEQLAEVEEIGWVESTAYAEMAVLFIELQNDTSDPDRAWDEVREAVQEARYDLPDGVGEPRLNDEVQGEQESVVLALTGSADPLHLLAAARELEDEVLRLRQVAKVLTIADPGEQVTVEVDDAAATRLGLSTAAVAAQLAARTEVIAGGSLQVAGKTVRLRPLSELRSLQEIATTPISLPSGASLPLSELGQVRLGPREPAAARMFFNGEMAVGLGIVARDDVNLVTFGREVRRLLAAVAPRLAPVQVHEVAFQPQRVADRLADLNSSLLLGILIVAGVVILAMGLRLGLVVASVVPLVAAAALAIFALGGGVLHQISVAALVLALGMLVDNAIVVAENVQWRIDRGSSHRQAAVAAVRELAVPLAAATGTTLAAFVPMLLAKGPTADFTRSIPVLIILTLAVSYLFAILVTPIMSQMALRPGDPSAAAFSGRLGRRLSSLALRRPWPVLVAAGMLVAASLVAAGWVQKQFFPSSDRNQLTVELKLPEGSHLDATTTAARTLGQALMARSEVRRVASFIGRSTPKFYYNIQRVPWSPHLAQLMVETGDAADIGPLVEWIREQGRQALPEAEVIPRKLEQGPPVVAPVEIRLFGDDLPQLHRAATQVAGELRALSGTIDVRHDLGPGAPNLRIAIDDAAAARYGLSRRQVAQALLGRTRGLPVGQLPYGEDPIPVVVRSSDGEHLPVEDLAAVQVSGPGGSSVPLAQVAHLQTTWRPAAIKHRDRRRVVTVTSQLQTGFTYSDVLAALQPRLAALQLPAGIELGYGGDAEGSGEANSAMMRVMPIGLVLLLGVLLAEFNSFRRVAIILVTVPLAAAGVIPGLLVASQPFGFMSMLGVIALVGIVVNNAIVLLEVVESRRREGAGVAEALEDAVRRRIRPILLTTATTVAGLLPLAFSSSTLWPPLAWAMISGLLASTLLTLVVVPSLYLFLLGSCERTPVRLPRLAWRRAATMLLVIGVTTVTGPAAAEERLTLEETMALAADRPLVQASRERAEAAAQASLAERRSALLPVVGGSFSLSERDRDLAMATPIGELPFGDRTQRSAVIEAVQPLLDPSRLLHAVPAARHEAEAARLAALRARQEAAAVAAAAHLQVLAVDARAEVTAAFIASLAARLAEVQEMVVAGRALEADTLKLLLAKEQAEQDLLALQQSRVVSVAELARSLGRNQLADPAPVPSLLERPAPDEAAAVEQALTERYDLAASEAALAALGRRRSAVAAERLPRLEARARWTWSDGSPYTTSSWIEGAVRMTWTPFAAATRGPRAAAVAAEQRAIAAELTEARQAVTVAVRAALADLEVAHGSVRVAERGAEQATETLRVERERYRAGRATTNDLLDAEARLRERRTTRDLAHLEVVHAWVQLWLASGVAAYHPAPSGGD